MEITNSSLWKEGAAHIPSQLSEQYIRKLNDIGMYEHAKDYDPKSKGAVGGETTQETHKHFAERFLNSCVRLQFVAIDPGKKYEKVVENLFSTFCTGKIALLDSPCGTGAGSLSLLFTLMQLRLEKKIPTLPLKLKILGADYSESALELYSQMLDEAIPILKQVSISVEYEVIIWDAFSNESTLGLLEKYKSINAEEYFVLSSAFSGVGKDLHKQLSGVFGHIQFNLSTVPYTIVHIEPGSNEAKNLLSQLLESFSRLFHKDRKMTPYKDFIRFKWFDVIKNKMLNGSVTVALNERGEK